MIMQELEKNTHYKILQVELPAGTNMQRHYATSEAFVIVESGNALLICKGETAELVQGSRIAIPSHEPHMLKVIRDFKALVVMAGDAIITYSVL
ncbi:cupin domain-containing protein [Mucilaginibacter sp. 14171R-50]|uniref:cupin domain-containing protein n=1 Tax=Mucilaginibacter sp. 14171R-50 TaxID=2703789 RepID=UPI00138B3422|nr:cupin domain-containing protein [Mucilaginibacter sp. 14171R-50]QHS56593.1 cupin domain-containing protein [Mucilaginibacter sp. 14171R-50]